MNIEKIEITSEIAAAFSAGNPVVALESTIIAHGMPYPQNIETAIEVERIIRKEGAIPATIAILDGKMKVGLTKDEIGFLGTDKNIYKTSDREIPFILARHLHAATTVSASLAIATAAGINVFVTGGIGGVGPDGYKTLDISSDLMALSDYPCITVCAGAKAFMDIPGTLEYLETNRVGVVGYKTKTFPLFFTRDSNYRIDWSADSAAEVADIFYEKIINQHKGGLLVGVPLLAESALSLEETQDAIHTTLERISNSGITGKDVTPFILSTIKDATEGRSLTANIALIKNNAQAGAEIAVALANKLQKK
jgi:pseudouridylate synthase